jgi:hypothetical protein
MAADIVEDERLDSSCVSRLNTLTLESPGVPSPRATFSTWPNEVILFWQT